MKVLLVRHAHAEAKGSGKADLERRLTPRGLEQSEQVGQMLVKLYPAVARIVSSAAVRSIETAEGIAKSFPRAQRLINPALNPGATWEQYVAVVTEATQDEDMIMLVGHEPDISQVVSVWIGAVGTRLKVPKLACVELDLDVEKKQSAELVALLPPRIFFCEA